jgi:hypothetical protein
LGDDLDLAGFHLWIGHPLRSFADRTGDLQHPFEADAGHQLGDLRRQVGIERDLHQAKTVAQVYKGHPAVVAAAMHPARQSHALTGMGGPQFSASMGLVH